MLYNKFGKMRRITQPWTKPIKNTYIKRKEEVILIKRLQINHTYITCGHPRNFDQYANLVKQNRCAFKHII